MALKLLPTLHSINSTDVCPSLNMVRSQRLYTCSAADINGRLGPCSMRDIFSLVRSARAYIGENNQVFITKKKIIVPRGLKRVPVEELLISIDMIEVRTALCDFLLNEIFPHLSPDEATEWSLDFLIEMDPLLSIPLENAYGEILTSYNFRTLKHRICTKQLSRSDCSKIMDKTSGYLNILRIFQDHHIDAFNDLV